MRKSLSSLLDILFPPRCGACKTHLKKNAGLCHACLAAIPQYLTLFCGTCHARLPGTKKVCHQQTPYILGAASSYADPALKDAIAALKFEHIRVVAKPLGDILASYWQHLRITDRPVVIPIPLSRRRRWERGFNQSALIAKRFCEQTGLPLETNLLKRTRHRKPQMQLPREERRDNISGCFSVVNEALVPKTVVLVDDVTTSGSTLAEAARTLKHAGARKVIGLAVARA